MKNFDIFIEYSAIRIYFDQYYTRESYPATRVSSLKILFDNNTKQKFQNLEFQKTQLDSSKINIRKQKK